MLLFCCEKGAGNFWMEVDQAPEWDAIEFENHGDGNTSEVVLRASEVLKGVDKGGLGQDGMGLN